MGLRFIGWNHPDGQADRFSLEDSAGSSRGGGVLWRRERAKVEGIEIGSRIKSRIGSRIKIKSRSKIKSKSRSKIKSKSKSRSKIKGKGWWGWGWNGVVE